MTFALLILTTAVMFLQPAAYFPELTAWSIYQELILVCLVVSLPGVLKQLEVASLASRPITGCVLGLLLAVILSHLSHFNLYDARANALTFAKLIVYYLAFVAIVDTPSRLRQFLNWLNVIVFIVTVLALLVYYDVIPKEAVKLYKPRQLIIDLENPFVRLRAAGNFNDPNDLCLILLAGMTITVYWMTNCHLGGLKRLLCLLPLGLYGYALALTRSRGGLIGMMVGLLFFFYCRFGIRKTLAVGLVVLPLAFLLLSRQQVDFAGAIDTGTGQSRIQIWAEGIGLFRQTPFFGIGMGEYNEQIRHPAHNSFLHAYTELGVFGGTLFLGAFYFALSSLYRLNQCRSRIADPELRRLLPFLITIVICYVVPLLALSRNYIVTTYMILGMVTVYVQMASQRIPSLAFRFDIPFLRRALGLGIVNLAVIYIIVRLFAHWGTA